MRMRKNSPVPSNDTSLGDSNISPQIRPKLLTAETISAENLDIALYIGDRCFFGSEQDEIRKTYLTWIQNGPTEFHSHDPFFAWISRLVNYQVYRGAENEPVGIGGLYQLKSEPQSYWLGWLGVDQSRRGAGYGSAIISDCEARAIADGGTTMKLYHRIGDPQIAEFYAKRGYERLGEIELYSVPRIVCEKVLR